VPADGDGDGDGDAPAVCDPDANAPGIDIGETGGDFVAIEEGDALPSWFRPQGGIGTRVNYKISGFPEDFEFDTIATNIYLTPTGTGADGQEGGACGDGCGDGLACFQDVCRIVVSDQQNAMVPRDCLPDGSVHISELPVRYKNELTLEDLDGRNADIDVVFTIGGETYFDAVQVVLDVGDFIFPSWWDETNQPG
jgi:hypothetical protein